MICYFHHFDFSFGARLNRQSQTQYLLYMPEYKSWFVGNHTFSPFTDQYLCLVIKETKPC